MRNWNVDFGIAPLRDSAEEFLFEGLFSEAIYAAIPKRLALPSRSEITLRRLIRLPTVGFSNDAALKETLNSALKQRGLQFETRYEFQRNTTLIAMAEAGVGAAIVPETALPLVRQRDLQLLPIVEPRIRREIGIVRLRGRSMSPAASRLTDLIRDQFARSGPRSV